MRLLVLGASGGVGSRLVTRALAAGHAVTAQTRTAGRAPAGAAEAVGKPDDPAFLAVTVPGHDAIAFCVGVDRLGATTLFSDSARALIAAMTAAGVRRIAVLTGIGAGDSRGHGGWLYNRVIYPLFTRHRYEDKTRQEELFAASSLDWTIVRAAPFVARAGDAPIEVHATIPPGLQLTAITRDEVAAFMLETLESGAHSGAKLFVGRQ
ncbi:MAG: NAD(P)H-binding protein [Alphaproteobacteria bacterium]|nr:NAD(P)H-binding protein [Alphaproteobacteria bacterium]